MKLAVMQPYFFPYVGYFQLIKAVDRFVFFDDVDYIKRGWINRNRILINGEAKYFTLACKNVSQHIKINQTYITGRETLKQCKQKLINTYAKAPYFEETLPVIDKATECDSLVVSDIAKCSVIEVIKHLGLSCVLESSSDTYSHTAPLKGQNRILAISQAAGADTYLNLKGGIDLYNTRDFSEKGITLNFVEPGLQAYTQRGNTFVSGLSIIDALMFVGKEAVSQRLNDFRLVERSEH